jgi:transcriptional regulator with XRE-family HTH domain
MERGTVVSRTFMATKDVQVRIRARIRTRLDELGMTARELARSVGHDDAWISGVLRGAHGIHWKDFDAVAEKLGISPSELVRHDNAELRELTPREMKLLRHYQAWPSDMQDRWLAMLDHFAATVPDRETTTLLDRLRALPRSVRRPVLSWLFQLLEESIPPEALAGGVVLGADEVPTAPSTLRPSPPRKRRSG